MSSQWTQEDEAKVRAYVEAEFRKETPPKHIAATQVAYRVHRALVWTWCDKHLGKRPPSADHEYLIEFAKWYRAMALRVVKEQDPTALPFMKRELRCGKKEIGYKLFGPGPR